MPARGHIPFRTCVGCRTKKRRDELLRVVLLEDGTVAWDRKKTLPGRGAYCCPDDSCLRAALRRRGFEKSFKRRVDPSRLLRELELGGLLDGKDQSV